MRNKSKEYIIITGGSGGIGSEITKFLQSKGFEIINLDIKSNKNNHTTNYKCDLSKVNDIKKIFIHQANMKMDDAIVKRLYRLYNKEIPKNILPMNIQSLGNSSVATIPTLFDQVLKGKIMNHKLNKNDLIVFASVGAGMNVNAMVYKI